MQRITALLLSLAALCGCDEGTDPIPTAAVVQTPFTGDEPKVATAPETSDSKDDTMPAKPAPGKYNELSDFESYVILEKGTERAYTGEYTDLKDPGTYICRRCNAPLYQSEAKFSSDCGWPSFDDEIAGAVEKSVDVDGYRVEITCRNCGGHLGHVFHGEGFTPKDTRHCVNSVSMKFIPKDNQLPPVIPPASATP